MKLSDFKYPIFTEVKIIAASFAIGLLATIVITATYSERVSARISDKFIRLHVIANSDTEQDQQLKLKVRDGVLESLRAPLSSCKTLGDAREMLTQSLPLIELEAEKIAAAEGYTYSAKASLEKIMFPTREYGDAVLVAGIYEALRIELGEAGGQNWWCVVYPPLCYVDIAQEPLSESVKSDLKNDLGTDYKLVVNDGGDVSVKVKFKVVELWQESKSAALAMLGK